MRLILSLTAVLLLSFNANAKVGEPRVGEIKAAVVEMPVLTSLNDAGLSSVNEINLAILYKMKENIIRRELSFTPKKKWLKWV
jgi:hypothetical protein